MDIIFTILNLSFLAWLSFRLYKKDNQLRPYFFPALCLKLVSGLLLGYLYLSYYDDLGDTLVFFKKANQLVNLAYSEPIGYIEYVLNSDISIIDIGLLGQPRALFFVKITSFFSLITRQSYWMTSLYFSFFSFVAIWYSVRVLIAKYTYQEAIVFSFFFPPSVVFWSSGVIKESVALGAITLFVAATLKLIENKGDFKNLIILLFSAVVLWKIKYYYAAVLFMVTTAYVLTTLAIQQWAYLKKGRVRITFFYLLICFFLLAAVTLLHPNFQLGRFTSVVVDNYNQFESISQKGDFIEYDGLTKDWTSIIYHSPKALFSGLFRPYIWESSDVLKLLYSFENAFFLILTIYVFFCFPRKISEKDYLGILSILIFSVILIIFLSLSAPNFGTLIRYKTGVMPFLFLLVTANNTYIKKVMQFIFKRSS